MLAFKENPFRNCGSDNITSSVVDLEVKRSNGSKVSISGLKNDIDIRIHHNKRPFDTDQEAFALHLNETSTQFHTFKIRFADVAVAIEFLSYSETAFQWTIMVGHEKRPSMADNLAFWSLDGKERKVLLLESLLLKVGTYYIQVKAASNIRSSSAESITLTNASASYSLKVSTIKCLYWREEDWSQDGCRVGIFLCLLGSNPLS